MDDPIGSQLLFQLLLILINAFFASTETAVVSLNENKVRKQAEDGDKRAALMLHMIESPTRFLSTIQVCITLSGFLASAFAADSFASVLAGSLTRAGFALLPPAVLHTVCVVLITLILSYFMIVLGELVPKRIALKDPERIARVACPVIRGMSKFFLPLVWLLTISTNAMLRLLRINPNDSSEEVTEEEIRMMVDIGSENGAIEQDERTMIENIFEFNNTTAADVMVHRMDVVALHVDESREEILRTIRESGLSRFPVYDNDIDDIIGVLNTRDFLLNAQQGSAHELGKDSGDEYGPGNGQRAQNEGKQRRNEGVPPKAVADALEVCRHLHLSESAHQQRHAPDEGQELGQEEGIEQQEKRKAQRHQSCCQLQPHHAVQNAAAKIGHDGAHTHRAQKNCQRHVGDAQRQIGHKKQQQATNEIKQNRGPVGRIAVEITGKNRHGGSIAPLLLKKAELPTCQRRRRWFQSRGRSPLR